MRRLLLVCFVLFITSFLGCLEDPPENTPTVLLPSTESPTADVSSNSEVAPTEPPKPAPNLPEPFFIPPLPASKFWYQTLPDNALGTTWNMDCSSDEPTNGNPAEAQDPNFLVIKGEAGANYSVIGLTDLTAAPPSALSAQLQLYCLSKSADAHQPSGYSAVKPWHWLDTPRKVSFCFGFLEPYVFDSPNPLLLEENNWASVDLINSYGKWKSGESPNNGLILLSLRSGEYGVYASGSYPDQTKRPQLRVVFSPKLDLKLPLPAGDWILGTQCGGKVCGGPEETDKFHKGLGFYALDFLPVTSSSYNPYHRESNVPILAAADGTVDEAGWSESYGWRVYLNHGWGYRTLYAHFADGSLAVKTGDSVIQGQRLGIMGSTPGGIYSTGIHLHFGITFEGSGEAKTPELYHNVMLEDQHWTDYYIWCSGKTAVNSWQSTNHITR